LQLPKLKWLDIVGLFNDVQVRYFGLPWTLLSCVYSYVCDASIKAVSWNGLIARY